MGYWSEHPMAGDMPMEAEMSLFYELGVGEEYENMLNIRHGYEKAEEEFLKLLEKSIGSNLDNALKCCAVNEYSFVVPYVVLSNGIKILDKDLSEKIKALLGDGGACDRGYDTRESNLENGYNGFKSPSDYIAQIRDNWDKLMTGEVDYSQMSKFKGLFEALSEDDSDNSHSLINVR